MQHRQTFLVDWWSEDIGPHAREYEFLISKAELVDEPSVQVSLFHDPSDQMEDIFSLPIPREDARRLGQALIDVANQLEQ